MFVVLSMIVIVMEPVLVLFAFVLFYIFSGPVNMIIAWHKKRALRRLEPVPEEDLVIRG
jgi:hypothetical protein